MIDLIIAFSVHLVYEISAFPTPLNKSPVTNAFATTMDTTNSLSRWGMNRMSLINCKQCGVLVLKIKTDYCPECQSERDNCFFELRNYLRINPKCTVWEAHQKTGISLAQLLQFNKEAYFSFRL
jgi:predicted Zn-ribbon and HTH transcriptional regulator